MKKLFALAFIAVGFAACNNDANDKDGVDTLAVNTTTNETNNVVVQPQQPAITYTEGDVSRRDGKVVVYKGGQWAPVEKDVVLEDGTVVNVKGEAKNKEGKVYVMEDGYYVTKAGRFFDRTGAAINNAWEATKNGVENAAQATKEGINKAADAVKDGAEKVGDHLQQRHDQKVEDLKNATR